MRGPVCDQRTAVERATLVAYAEKHGLANTARVVLNLAEFMFVD